MTVHTSGLLSVEPVGCIVLVGDGTFLWESPALLYEAFVPRGTVPGIVSDC